MCPVPSLALGSATLQRNLMSDVAPLLVEVLGFLPISVKLDYRVRGSLLPSLVPSAAAGEFYLVLDLSEAGKPFQYLLLQNKWLCYSCLPAAKPDQNPKYVSGRGLCHYVLHWRFPAQTGACVQMLRIASPGLRS